MIICFMQILLINRASLSLTISLFALVVSAAVGFVQIKTTVEQSKMQNIVELYLLCQPFTIKDAQHKTPDIILPAIYIRNIGNNVIYLNNYVFNGEEHPLGREVLPPASAFDGFRYIFLPLNGTEHISLEINFYDWKNRPWITRGFADYKNGQWEVTYEPCMRKRK